MRPGIEIFRAPAVRSLVLRLLLALLVLRLGAHIPLFPELPDLRSALRTSPFLMLLDVFSGGAVARGSAFSLGLFPYFLARPLLALFGRDEPPPWKVRKRLIRLTLVLAVALACLYPVFLSRVAGVPLSPRGVLVPLTLAAGAAFTLWLATLLASDADRLDSGAALLLALQVLTALPEALVSSGSPNPWLAVLLLVVVAGVDLLFLLAVRRFPLQSMQGEKKTRSSVLPWSLSSSGPAPLVSILAVFALLRLLAGILAGSAAGWARRLAAFELRWTGLGSWEGWIALALLGFLAKLAVGRRALDGPGIARELQISGFFLPGVPPGRETAALLDRTFRRLGWIEPLVLPGLLAGLAILALRLQPEAPAAPVLLVAALATVRPARAVVLDFRGRWAAHQASSRGFLGRRS